MRRRTTYFAGVVALAVVAGPVATGHPAAGQEPTPTPPPPPSVEEPSADVGNQPDTVPIPPPNGPSPRAVPPAPSFGLHIDDLARLDAQSTCSPSAKPGAIGLRDILLAAYPSTGSLGFSRACDVGSTSEHKEGRAFDWEVDARTQAPIAAEALRWLLATDGHGNRWALARRLGVMYIIWNRQIWRAYRPDEGWQPYTGPNPHTDHVHFSLSWAGARRWTTWWSPAGTHGPISPPPVGTPADFDGNGVDDVYLYAPGWAADGVRWGVAPGSFAADTTPVTISGDYTPVAGDFDGDGADDVLWYGQGGRADSLHAGTPGERRFRNRPDSIGGTYHPFVGDFDANGVDDVFFYGPGTLPDAIRWGTAPGSFASTTTSTSVGGVYEPYAGDFDGDGATDVLWYGRGPLFDSRWFGRPGQRGFSTATEQVDGDLRPFVGDFDGNDAADLFLYAPGGDADRVRWGREGDRTGVTRAVTVNGGYLPLVGDRNGDGADDIVWATAGRSSHPRWAGRPGVHAFTDGSDVLTPPVRAF